MEETKKEKYRLILADEGIRSQAVDTILDKGISINYFDYKDDFIETDSLDVAIVLWTILKVAGMNGNPFHKVEYTTKEIPFTTEEETKIKEVLQPTA